MTDSDDNPLLGFLLSRKSANTLVEPGPTRPQLDAMLRAAATVPDHGKLRPYRFAIIEGEGRAAFGNALAAVAKENRPEMPEAKLDGVRAKAQRSPSIIAVIASPKLGKIERWEQLATAASAGYAITLAAHALGVGAVWKSVPFTRGQALSDLFGMTADEEMLGWIHLGTPTTSDAPGPRESVDVAAFSTLLVGASVTPYR